MSKHNSVLSDIIVAMEVDKKLNMGAWALSIAVALIAFVAWGQSLDWQLGEISAYDLFPLFGLLAFSVMWSHYIVSVLRQKLGVKQGVVKQYFKYTSRAVLIFIVLHPGLLLWQLMRDTGKVLPIKEATGYAGPAMRWVVLLGAVSLFAFLAFELHRWYRDRSWWKYISAASDVAMLLIFYHSLRLGSNLQEGWFRYVWWFYGISLVGALTYIYSRKFATAKSVK